MERFDSIEEKATPKRKNPIYYVCSKLRLTENVFPLTSTLTLVPNPNPNPKAQ